MHDYAHGAHNKHLDGFFKSNANKTEHFHIACPSMANMEYMAELLSYISKNDLNDDEKQIILTAYHDYLTTPNLDRQIMIFEGYARVLAALCYDDHVLKKRMPIFSKTFDKINETLPPNVELENIDETLTADCNGYKINLKKMYNCIRTYAAQIEITQAMKDLLKKYKAKEIEKDLLISGLQEQFNKASDKPMINMDDVLPHAKGEWKNNLPYTDFNELYTIAAKELSSLLGTTLEFTPQLLAQSENDSAVTEINLPPRPRRSGGSCSIQ